MNRKDREVTDFCKIVEFLSSCQILRISMQSDDIYPYIVPVSFGFEVIDKELNFYFHCAKIGKKIDMLKNNPNVCIETDCFNGYVGFMDNTTTDYQSFIGFGVAQEVIGDEKVKGLDLLMKHCGFDGFTNNSCECLNQTKVFKITVNQYSCKKTFI